LPELALLRIHPTRNSHLEQELEERRRGGEEDEKEVEQVKQKIQELERKLDKNHKKEKIRGQFFLQDFF